MACPRIPFGPADPSPLWHRFKARWRHVYRTGKGERYAAQIWIGRVRYHLGSAPTPRGAAALAAGFLLAWYGPGWPALRRAAVSAANRRVRRGRRKAANSPPGAG